MRTFFSESLHAPESAHELPLGEPPFLVRDWPAFKHSVLEALGMEQWPENILSVSGRENDAIHIIKEIENEGASVSAIGFEALKNGLSDREKSRTEVVRALEKFNKTKPEDQLYHYYKDKATQAIQRLRALNDLLDQQKETVVLFIVNAKEVPNTLDLIQTLGEKSNASCAVLAVDPPHLWKEFTDEAPTIPFLEVEQRVGAELISLESRERAKDRLLDILAPLACYYVPRNGLVRAIRQQEEPASDIAIERDILAITNPFGQEDSTAIKAWKASQQEREERWKQRSPEVRARVARIIESYIRPREGEREQLNRLPETYAETILRFVALDPSCLPHESVTRAKEFFAIHVDSLVDELDNASRTGTEERPELRKTMMLKADNVLLHPAVNHIFHKLLDFQTRTCVKSWEENPWLRSPELAREILARIDRAKQAGCNVDRYEHCAGLMDAALDTSSETEVLSQDKALLEIDRAIMTCALNDDIEGALGWMDKKAAILYPQREQPTITPQEMRGQISLYIGVVLEHGGSKAADEEVKKLNSTLASRLAKLYKPTGQDIAAIKEEIFEQWREDWGNRFFNRTKNDQLPDKS